MYIISIVVKVYKCLRCGHMWTGRRSPSGRPMTCAKCRSPYWYREKVRK